MGKQQVHKRLGTESVKDILVRYDERRLDLIAALALLGVKRSRFFKVLAEYRANKNGFTSAYERATPKRISVATEDLIKKELLKEKKLIINPKIPITEYNYAAVHDTLRDVHKIHVSTKTIIRRAKEYDCYLEPRIKKIHDREVITNYVGELIQHDSSHHQWSPYVDAKWYGITSLDDYSRRILFGDLFEVENRWNHILASESLILTYGCPQKYYADQHSIFRFVEKRDSQWKKNILETDAVDPQWKQTLKECGVGVTYALSPQAKGKIERPYRWLQARVVRQCARDRVTKFTDVRQIFRDEIERYNNRQVHSTTKEIPAIRFERAVNNGQTMFRPFRVPEPFQSSKDIFCIRATRVVDAYRKISIANFKITIPKVPPKYPVELRMIPDYEKQIVEIRFWFKGELVGTQIFKEQDLPIVQF